MQHLEVSPAVRPLKWSLGVKWLRQISVRQLAALTTHIQHNMSVRCPVPGPVWPRGFQEVYVPKFHDIRHMKVLRFSATRTGRLYPPGMFLVLTLTRGWVNPSAVVRSEGNMSQKNPVTPPGIDPWTVRLLAQRLNHYATPGPTICLYFNKISLTHS